MNLQEELDKLDGMIHDYRLDASSNNAHRVATQGDDRTFDSSATRITST